MSTKRKPEKQDAETVKPVGRPPKSGYGSGRNSRLVVLLTEDEDVAYRDMCKAKKKALEAKNDKAASTFSRQTPARHALAALYPFISKY